MPKTLLFLLSNPLQQVPIATTIRPKHPPSLLLPPLQLILFFPFLCHLLIKTVYLLPNLPPHRILIAPVPSVPLPPDMLQIPVIVHVAQVAVLFVVRFWLKYCFKGRIIISVFFDQSCLILMLEVAKLLNDFVGK